MSTLLAKDTPKKGHLPERAEWGGIDRQQLDFVGFRYP
jgi:hypothetical protein